MTVRLGVLGCASVAARRIVPAAARVPEVEVVAVASRDLDRARAFTARHGGEPLAGYDRLLARDDIDAVYVPLPNSLHAPWARRCLEAGKHVLVEKPAVTNYRDAVELVALARAGRLVLAENFMFLHHSQHRHVAELVAGGAIGDVRVFAADFGIPPLPAGDIRYDRDLDGGALLDAGVYGIRAAQLFLGPRLTVVGTRLRAGADVDDGGGVLLAAPDGVIVQVAFGFGHGYRSAYTLWGSAGRITVDPAFSPPDTHSPVIRLERQDRVEKRRLPADDQFANALRAFAAAVQAGAGAPTEGEALLRQAALVAAARFAAGPPA